jgi:hypothetical protein
MRFPSEDDVPRPDTHEFRRSLRVLRPPSAEGSAGQTGGAASSARRPPSPTRSETSDEARKRLVKGPGGPRVSRKERETHRQRRRDEQDLPTEPLSVMAIG